MPNSTEAIARLRETRAFLVDLDGTTYIDDELLPGSADFLARLRSREIPHVFLSNNSSQSGQTYVTRLEGLGIPATRERVFTSGDATIEYLKRRTEHRSAYVVGTEALIADFEAAGFDTDADDPDCVIAAFDTTLDFAKLERACNLLWQDKPYYATHPDKTCITARGLIPDVAAVIGACEAVTGRRPVIIGKPEKAITELALEILGHSAADTAIVGDQLDTDMTMGRQSGLLSCLVLSGETARAKFEAMPKHEQPDVVVANLAELLEYLS